jgi:hypothetical protein
MLRDALHPTAWLRALGAILSWLIAAGAVSADQLDQSFGGPGTAATVSVNASFARAQTFTVGLDGTLTRIAIPIGKSDLTLDTDELTVDVRPTDGGGAPLESAASALVTATVLGSQLTEFLDPENPFEIDVSAAGVQVTAGQQLAIVASSDAPLEGSRSFHWYAYLVQGDGYPGGDAWIDPSVWALQNGGGVDLDFETWVEVPEPAAGACAAAALAVACALARRATASPGPASRPRRPRSRRVSCRGRGARAAGRATAA